MECINMCGTELIGRQVRYCSDKCRMQHNRTHEDGLGSPNSNEPEHNIGLNPNKVEHEHKPEQLPDDMFSELISWQDIADLPRGVVKPTVRPTDTESNGGNWWNHPDYAKTIETLLTSTLDELNAMPGWVPNWCKRRAEIEYAVQI